MIDFGLGVILEPLDTGIKEKIRSWRNDRDIFIWCRQKTLISDLEQEAWFNSQAHDPTIKMFAVSNKQKTSVGVCGFTSIDHFNRRAEFSLYIAKEHQKHGYGAEALRVLFNHGFLDLGFNCIWGETFEGNPATKTFEKIGMKREGTRRQFYFKNGKMIDAHIYSVLGSEWTL